MDVGGWLRSLGLGQYEALFRASEIDADILPELTDLDLEKLGVPLGHRKRLLRAISGLTTAETSSAPASAGATPQDAAERRQLTVMFCDLGRPRGSRTRRVERLSLLRRAHDYHRDLRTRLPAAVVAYPVDRARQFMTMTPLSPSPNTAPTNLAISPAAPTLRRQRPSTPPSADKTWSTEYQITAPIPSTAAKTSAQLVAQPSSCPEPTNQIKQRRRIPHRPTPASVPTPPAVSSFEAFRTPASVHPLASA